MSLEELAEKLREELIINGDCKEIVDKIRGARHVDGSELTVEEKETIINGLLPKPRYVNGHRVLTESDNSAFLAMVKKIRDTIMEGK